MRNVLEEVSQMPVHEASFIADNYARPKREQRIRITVRFSDGFGRILQASVLNEPKPLVLSWVTGKKKANHPVWSIVITSAQPP